FGVEVEQFWVFLFFFSSRRRHTRLQGDWSSDVCSSDLRFRDWTVAATGTIPESRASAYILASSRSTNSASDPPKMSFTPARMMRSEERRVGKECRARWGG